MSKDAPIKRRISANTEYRSDSNILFPSHLYCIPRCSIYHICSIHHMGDGKMWPGTAVVVKTELAACCD